LREALESSGTATQETKTRKAADQRPLSQRQIRAIDAEGRRLFASWRGYAKSSSKRRLDGGRGTISHRPSTPFPRLSATHRRSRENGVTPVRDRTRAEIWGRLRPPRQAQRGGSGGQKHEARQTGGPAGEFIQHVYLTMYTSQACMSSEELSRYNREGHRADAARGRPLRAKMPPLAGHIRIP
jgi:hypothetical protein